MKIITTCFIVCMMMLLSCGCAREKDSSDIFLHQEQRRLYVEQCFKILQNLQSNDKDKAISILNKHGDENLRKKILLDLKNGKEEEAIVFLNLYINSWLIANSYTVYGTPFVSSTNNLVYTRDTINTIAEIARYRKSYPAKYDEKTSNTDLPETISDIQEKALILEKCKDAARPGT